MPELHLKQPGFTYSACGPFTKHCKRIPKFWETGNLKHLYRNESEQAGFANDVACFDSKDLANFKKIISDRFLKDRGYEVAGNREYDGHERALSSMISKFFEKKTGSGISVIEQLAEELHKPIIDKFKRRKVSARFKDNIWTVNLAEMESLFSKNKNIKYETCVIDVFFKYVWVKLLKDKNIKTVLNVFIEIVNESNHKPNKGWSRKRML